MGIFWPCPSLDHPGTPRLFVDKKFYTHDGKAHFNVTEWRPSGDPIGDEYPLFLTTGRVVSQYLSGTQTRRIGALVDQNPEPRAEVHPRLAEQYGFKDGDWITVTTRRDDLTIRVMVVKTIRPDTVFIPYHWAGIRSANRLLLIGLSILAARSRSSRSRRAGLPKRSDLMSLPMIESHTKTADRGEATSVRIRILCRSLALYWLSLLLAGV